jgi:ribose-phosphate pyrophosphokinase
MDSDLRIFAMDSGSGLGGAVATAAGVALSPHEERTFEDGEHKVRPLVSVRGSDVYVLDSLHGDERRSVHDKLCRLLFFVAAVRDAGAARVTVVAPYLAYGRKDRRTKPRDPVTTRYVATLMEAAGADVVVTLDVHNAAAYQNAFRVRAEHLEGQSLFVRHFVPLIADDPVAVVSPDSGGAKRADSLRRALATALGRDVNLVFLEKRRSEGVVSGAAVVGDVAERAVIILDDLISSGTTMARAARACRENGADRVWTAVTHGLFTAGAADVLAEAPLDSLVVVNTIPPSRLSGTPLSSRLVVLDAAPLIGEAIRRLHTGGSITELVSDGVPRGR